MSIYTDYKCLVSKYYRVIMNFLIPVGLGIVSLITSVIFDSIFFNCCYVIMSIITMVGDYFGFGCICKKGSFGMEYVRTSFRGNEALEHALFLDLLSGMMRNLLFVFIGGFFVADSKLTIPVMIVMCLLLNVVYLISVNVTRYMELFYSIYLVVMLLSVIMVTLLTWLLQSGLNEMLLIVILAAMILISFAGTYYHMISRLRASYIDE